jgi:hypothetical protein
VELSVPRRVSVNVPLARAKILVIWSFDPDTLLPF